MSAYAACVPIARRWQIFFRCRQTGKTPAFCALHERCPALRRAGHLHCYLSGMPVIRMPAVAVGGIVPGRVADMLIVPRRIVVLRTRRRWRIMMMRARRRWRIVTVHIDIRLMVSLIRRRRGDASVHSDHVHQTQQDKHCSFHDETSVAGCQSHYCIICDACHPDSFRHSLLRSQTASTAPLWRSPGGRCPEAPKSRPERRYRPSKAPALRPLQG